MVPNFPINGKMNLSFRPACKVAKKNNLRYKTVLSDTYSISFNSPQSPNVVTFCFPLSVGFSWSMIIEVDVIFQRLVSWNLKTCDPEICHPIGETQTLGTTNPFDSFWRHLVSDHLPFSVWCWKMRQMTYAGTTDLETIWKENHHVTPENPNCAFSLPFFFFSNSESPSCLAF